MNPFQLLSDEALLEVLLRCYTQDFPRLCQSCRRFSHIFLRDNFFYKTLIKRRFDQSVKKRIKDQVTQYSDIDWREIYYYYYWSSQLNFDIKYYKKKLIIFGRHHPNPSSLQWPTGTITFSCCNSKFFCDPLNPRSLHKFYYKEKNIGDFSFGCKFKNGSLENWQKAHQEINRLEHLHFLVKEKKKLVNFCKKCKKDHFTYSCQSIK